MLQFTTKASGQTDFLKRYTNICSIIGVLITFFILRRYSKKSGGGFFEDARRSYIKGEGIYQVLGADGAVLFHADVQPLLHIILWLFLGAAAAGFCWVIFSYRGERVKIMQILQPINEIAMRADELGRMSFSEDKYQLIEEAITKLQPQDSEMLTFGD